MTAHPPEPVSVLLAEHEPEVAEMSARYLRRDGLRVRLVTSPEPTLAELAGGPDAAAVIDLTMPGLDPRRIRRAQSSITGRIPVIFLVGDARAPRPRGLAVRNGTAGARRWLARPFSPRQLVALVREVMADSGEPARSAPRLDPALTATESAVLATLIDHPGRVLSRRQLLIAAGRPGAGERAADVYIAQLRAKLGPAWPVRTVRGTGYILDPGGPIPGGQSPRPPDRRATIGGAPVPMRGDERTG
jgi:DNA-binding response OmpR family regulator